ncbi:hypothetical protein COCNU_01G012840 [Cocos nucifera]|uniref:Uncharacterized protein n=1 Tax=Cocos nucifera TaxID=13894 RepID=A0A8K0HW96_COCNU|nr:hypothetical protein COCNU_01G012840 [Cocos nucifera]
MHCLGIYEAASLDGAPNYAREGGAAIAFLQQGIGASSKESGNLPESIAECLCVGPQHWLEGAFEVGGEKV